MFDDLYVCMICTLRYLKEKKVQGASMIDNKVTIVSLPLGIEYTGGNRHRYPSIQSVSTEYGEIGCQLMSAKGLVCMCDQQVLKVEMGCRGTRPHREMDARMLTSTIYLFMHIHLRRIKGF